MIPEITGAKLDERPAGAVAFEPPLVCPRCGGEIDKTQKRWRCISGRVCGAKESLNYFTTRDAMDIEGLGDKILDNLIAAGLVTDPADLYALDVATLTTLDRLGTVSATKLVNNVQGSKTKPLSRVLTGLGVRMTGRSMSRRLARHFGTMQALQAATIADLQQVEGVGPERATTIAAEMAEIAPVIAKLIDYGVNMTEPGSSPTLTPASTMDAARLPLQHPDGSPMTVVVTGSVPGLTRNEGNEAVERLGGKSSSSVSARTDLVVIGDGAGTKAAKAAELSLKTMPADKLAALLTAHLTGDHSTVQTILQDGQS